MIKKMFSSPIGVFLLALLCTISFGLCYPLIKLTQQYFSVAATDVFSQFLIAGIRLILSGAIIMIVAFATKSFKFPTKNQAGGIIAVMLFQTVIHYALTYLGQGMTDGSKTPMLKETSSLFIIIIMHFVTKDDKLNAKKLMGCIIGFLGIVVMNISFPFNFSFSAGDGIILAAALSNAVGYVFLKLSVKDASPLSVMSLSQLTGGAVMLIIGLFGGGKLTPVSGMSYFVLAMIVLTTAFPYLVWSELYKYNKASTMSVYGLMTPLFGMIATALFFPGTSVFNLQNAVALVLIVSGISIANFNLSKKKNDSTDPD